MARSGAGTRSSADVAGVRKVIAVFTKEVLDGGATTKYRRQPFNIVQFDWKNGEMETYIELVLGNRFKRYDSDQITSTPYEDEEYDDVWMLSPADLAAYRGIYRDRGTAK